MTLRIQILGSDGPLAVTAHSRPKSRQVKNQRPERGSRAGHAADRSGAANRDRGSVVLLLPRALAPGGVPHVPGGSGKGAEAPNSLHARRNRGNDGAHGHGASAASAQGHARISPDEPPA